MIHPAALEKLLAVRSALDAAPGLQPRLDLRYLDDVLRAYAAEKGHPATLWDRSFADWTGQAPLLVPLLQDLLSGLRQHLEQTHAQDDGANALLTGPALGLLHARFPDAVPDPATLMQAVEEQYQREKTLWAESAGVPLFAVGCVDAGQGRRAIVYTDPGAALLDFLHSDRPGHRMRLDRYPYDAPIGQMIPVSDLLPLASNTGTSGDLVRAAEALWLRCRLTADAPGLAGAEPQDPGRQRWSRAAADWYATFRTPLSAEVIETALQQDTRQRAGNVPALPGGHARARPMPAPGLISRPVPDDVHALTQTWTAATRTAVQTVMAARVKVTADLTGAYRLLTQLADPHPLNEAYHAVGQLLAELTLRDPLANRWWALKAPLVPDLLLGQADAAANPLIARLVLDPAREQMLHAASSEARDLTAAQYAPPADPDADPDADADADAPHTTLRAPDQLLAELQAGPEPTGLREDPYGTAWRTAHPRAARAYTQHLVEAARPARSPQRAKAQAILEQIRTARLEAFHAMLGRLHAHRPDHPVGPLSARPVPTRAEELEQTADRTAVLAAFSTTHDAHRCLDGMILSLNNQMLQTQDTLHRAHAPESNDAALVACGQHERATELRALIEAAWCLQQIAPGFVHENGQQMFTTSGGTRARRGFER
ncbi:hypothetical protein ACFU5O_36825 [Streptomyces sp. NPDC057445]|uniref:hypothetical protein n=1 Tax=Streptomyces sp. NPDC057445 TaxID=3346136 RepID=UPI0036961C8F